MNDLTNLKIIVNRLPKYNKIIFKHRIIIFILTLKIIVYSKSITLMVKN